jgi:peptidoglycan hydrolase-like protein with peptidoglycan-binding domain
MDGGDVLGEGQPGQGDDSQRQTGDGGSGGEPQPQTAAEILGQGKAAGGGRKTVAARVGLTASVIAGVAVAVGIGGLAVMAHTSGSHAGKVRAAGAQAKGNPNATPLKVVAVSPATNTKHVNGATTVMVDFSAPLASDSVKPSFRPAVAGQWQASGSTLSFVPSVPFSPSTHYTLVIPGGRMGLHSDVGGLLAKSKQIRFSTGGYSQLRLAEVLSQLGYLPMTWQQTGSARVPDGQANGGVEGQERLAYSPPPGRFTWKSGYPASLRASWIPGHPNVVVRGAVMAFQAQHRLAINGVVTKKLWTKLFAAAASSQGNTVGYSYAIVSKGSPETLTIWHDGHKVLRSLANTGISIDPTASGTYPVYLRFRFQIMQGTNPDGSHYADPVSYVSYFDGGEAVHYFPRGSYGSPQSLGCVELAMNDAKRAYPYLTYGSLVMVTG